MMNLIPAPYRWLALVLVTVGLVSFGYVKGVSHELEKWNIAKAALVTAQDKAILARVAENTAKLETQKSENATITKVKNDEIDSVRSALANAQRLRRPAFCAASDGLATTASAPSTVGGDAATATGGLLSERVDDDIKALILKTEEVAATGRACQAFVVANGMAP